MELKGKIKFLEDEIEVIYPEDFNLCKKKISEMIGLNEEEMLEKISLYYNDEDGDKVIINEKIDYDWFINYLKENKKDLISLVIELKEQSENLANKISKAILDYKEKHSEEINLIKKELESNEENVNKINNDKINNNEINNDKKDSDNINIIKEGKKDNMNKINNYDILDYDFDELNEISNENKINNYNDNHNKINDNEKNENDIDNIKLDNDLSKNINMENHHSIIYQETCKFCKAYPLYDVFYFCTKCNYIMCSKCEKEKGSLDSHPLFKIQTRDQYMNSDIKLEKNIINHIKGYGDVIKGVFTSITDIVRGGKNDNKNNNENDNANDNKNKNNYNKTNDLKNKVGNNNNNINLKPNYNDNDNSIKDENNYKALAQELINNYKLDGVSEEKLEEALKLTNGDINEALQSLFI